MTSNNFNLAALGMPASGLASRRGGQNIKPLSFDSIKTANETKDNGAPTPRTSRAHMLAGLRTAPKTAVPSSFSSQNTMAQQQQQPQQHQYGRNPANLGYGTAQDYNAPKTALPRFGHQQQGYNMAVTPQYTAEQVLAPPQIQIDDQSVEHMDPEMYAQLVHTNLYLAQQQQQLQQQLRNIQAAAQQFQGLSISRQQQQYGMYDQAAGMMQSPMSAQPVMIRDPTTNQVYVLDQTTGQFTPYDANAQVAMQYALKQQQQLQMQMNQQLQIQYQMQQQQQQQGMPRVQVSPPPEHTSTPNRSNSPPKRYESPAEHTPLPPPSANAFRRGHKKSSSLANANGLSVNIPEVQRGPKTAGLPMTPLTGSYGPGQARVGEHPIRQPRGPPSFEDLSKMPTSKHEGSKNFATRTRRSAVHNLVRAGQERRKGTSSSTGSMSPVSESAEESETPITDNDSDSGRSGSGSLSGDVECSVPSSRTSTSGSWGAIGSDRPSSRQKTRDSVGSATSTSEMDGSFASLLKNGSAAAKVQSPDGQRKAPRLVLTKSSTPAMAA